MQSGLMTKFRFLLFMLVMFSIAGQSRAVSQNVVTFKTSSQNVSCAVINVELHCEVISLRYEFHDSPLVPGWCDSMWGASFGLEPRGKPFRICGWGPFDRPLEPSRPQKATISPKTVTLSGFKCKVNSEYLSCKNMDNHGFELSDKNQRFF